MQQRCRVTDCRNPKKTRLSETPQALDEFTIRLGTAGVGLRSLTTERASLEDLFFRLTEGDREEAA